MNASTKILKAAAGASATSGTVTVDQVFSTTLYTGNGTANTTITNDIDLAGEGGLVWTKSRSNGYNHTLIDTARGANKELISNATNDETTRSGIYSTITAFNSNGYTLGQDAGSDGVNKNSVTYASWTFRKAPKFFDIVGPYAGDGQSSRSLAHNLGSTPGMVLIKSTTNAQNWAVYHTGVGLNKIIHLNLSSPEASSIWYWDTAPTSTHFNIKNDHDINQTGKSYIAYLFADNSSEDAADRMISCGSYTGNGSTTGPVINVGFQPQFIFYKCATVNEHWEIIDSVRGVTTNGDDKVLRPSFHGAELNTQRVNFLSNGWQPKDGGGHINGSGQTYIYMAIKAED